MKAIILVLMKRGLTVLIVLLFLSSMLNAQGVLIKETVSIAPRSQNAQMQISTIPVPPASKIRLEVSYSGSVNPNPNNTFHTKYFNPYCDTSTSGDWYGELVIFETPATAGAGAIGTFSLEPISEGLFSIKWYYGDLIIRDQSSWVSCLPCTVANFPYYDKMGCGFALNKPPDILFGGTCNLSKQYPIAHEPCVSPGWVDTFGIVISITDGTSYGEFRSASGVSLGNSFICYLNEINTHYYIANGEEPDSSGGTVRIQATSGAITSETSFKVWKQPLLEKFIVTTDPDTIPNYEYSWMSVHPIDNFGNTYPLADNTRITLTAPPDSGVFYPAVPTYKQIKDHSVVYCANFEPEQLQDIDITASALGASGTAKVTVWGGESCPLIELSATEINPGDTVTITMTASYRDGTQGPYPPSQKFDIKLNTGQAYGKLYSPSTYQEGSALTSVPQPIEFIAANSIDEDSVVVEIDVWPTDGGSSALIRDGTKDTFTLQQSVSDSRLKEIISTERKVENVTLPMSKVVEQDEAQSSASKKVPSIDKLNKLQQTFNADPPCSPRGWVTINGFHHFEVKIVPDTAATADTIAFTEGAKLIIQAQDRDSNDIEYDANTLLKLSLLTNGEYGTFIDVNNDTLKTTPVELTNVLYSDAKAGRIKFAAVKKNPDSVITCKIRVEKQIDTTKHGEKDAVVVEQTLKIVITAQFEVVPRNLQGARIPPNPTNENKKQFAVQMTRNNVGIANHTFRLTTNYVDYTGGHSHVNRRGENNSVQKRVNYGYFILTRDTTAFDRPYNGQTQMDGRETFDYVSSEFGDSMRIIVKSTKLGRQKYFQDSITIAERVRGLDVLVDGANYDLIGGTAAHHGPPGYVEDHNHYAQDDVRQTLVQIADEWHQQYPQVILEVNDMSLPNGGGFDVLHHNWDADIIPGGGHQMHRNGRNVDLRVDKGHPGIPLLRDSTGHLIRDPISRVPRANPIFGRICNRYRVRHQIDSQDTDFEHYHLGF
jgi:hypothetical protein